MGASINDVLFRGDGVSKMIQKNRMLEVDGGSKIVKYHRTSFMDDPYVNFIYFLVGLFKQGKAPNLV